MACDNSFMRKAVYICCVEFICSFPKLLSYVNTYCVKISLEVFVYLIFFDGCVHVLSLFRGLKHCSGCGKSFVST